MKQSPLLAASLLCLLLPVVAQNVTADNNQNPCKTHLRPGELHVRDSTGDETYEELSDVEDAFLCLLYPTNILNCSWSFRSSEENEKLSVSVSVCGRGTLLESKSQSFLEKSGSLCWTLTDPDMQQVIVHFNTSLHPSWKSYTYIFEKHVLTVLSPPPLSASINDESLNITWDIPDSLMKINSDCYDFQLQMVHNENLVNLSGKLFYTETIADPALDYSVRIRNRISDHCVEYSHWSDWSPTISVKQQPRFDLNLVVILSILFGIPMMLLAVLLLLRQWWFQKILFPPIPHLPENYKSFLERNDPPSVQMFGSRAEVKEEEEITQVEVTEQSP